MQKKVSLYLLILLLVPVILYGIYQISSLSEDEENINMIYQNQLDAILFSINQYSDDVVSEWIMSMENAMDKDDVQAALDPLLQVNPGISMVFLADSLSGKILRVYPEDLSEDPVVQLASDSLMARKQSIGFMLQYAQSGYRKIESAHLARQDGNRSLMLYFVLDEPSPEGYRIGGILVDPESFIQVNLGPRLQTIAQEKFIISAFRKEVETPIFSTTDSVLLDPENSMAITKDFWLLPDYFLGIGTQGENIFNIIRMRTLLNIGLLVFMLVILTTGLYMIFRNVKKELLLAQNKAEFVSNVSHELRTPLALISMFAETLEMDRVRSEEKKHEYYKIIHKETTRLTGIVNKILTFSQMDAKKKEFHFGHIDLNEIVRDILETYSFHFKQKGFTSTFNVASETLPVLADREALQEVLINLLDNAMKYSGDKKEIQLTSGTDDRMAFLHVKDYGIGISKHDQKHIFDKFYRVSTGDIAKSKGTGLGLSLVKHIVTQHGGTIRVESTPGIGSTFSIYLPLTTKHNG